MEICISLGSTWFRVAAVGVFIYFVATLFLFAWGFRLLLRFQYVFHNTKNKAQFKSISDVSRPLLKKCGNKDVSRPLLKKCGNKANKVNKDAKDSSVQAVRVFTYQSLVDATQNFISARFMYADGLGHVYLGQMLDTAEVVVVRRFVQKTRQSVQGFVEEAVLLSQANHPNLAKLIGYCTEQHNRLLVYDYIPGMSLRDRLLGNTTCLDWNARMRIVLGIARALQYLQNVMKPPILHGFLNLYNIWLDGKGNPTLSGFGVIRMYPSRDGNCPYDMWLPYVYGIHDYYRTGKFTLQSDIEGFGFVLLQMITGRKEIFPVEGGSEKLLVVWVKPYLKDFQNLSEMVDPRLEGRFNKSALYEACKLAESCLNTEHSSRPLISDVIKQIEALVTMNL